MTAPYTEAFLKEILDRALDATVEGRREHIYRRDHQTGRRVIYHLKRDLEKLDACCPKYDITSEKSYWEIILECLESAYENPLSTYRRPQEPICGHKEADGHEMYAFAVQLPDFTRPIYTKFCLVEKTDGTWYVSIDCHT